MVGLVILFHSSSGYTLIAFDLEELTMLRNEKLAKIKWGLNKFFEVFRSSSITDPSPLRLAKKFKFFGVKPDKSTSL